MSTENLAILRVGFGARTLMAMLYSLNHGSDEQEQIKGVRIWPFVD